MAGYGNYDGGFYPNDPNGGVDPLDALVANDPNDDFDPLELLHSPLFDENRGGNTASGRGDNSNMNNSSNNHNSASSNQNSNDYGSYSGQQQRQQQQGIPQQVQVGGMDSSQASHASAPPYMGGRSNYVSQGTPSGQQGGFSNQFGGGMPSGNMNAGGNSNVMNPNSMPAQNMNGMSNAMPGNMNAGGGMNSNFGMPGGSQMGGGVGGGGSNQMGGNQMGANQMGGGPMQGGGMPVGNMNAGGLGPMNQLQGMQQALQMQQQGNPMQGGGTSPMMNPMQPGGPGPGMQGGQMMGTNPNMQGGMGPGPGMQNMQGGMIPAPANRNGSLNTAVSSLQGSMSQMNMGGGGGGGGGGPPQNMHASMPNIGNQKFPQQRGGSLPTSPNPQPSVAQMNASIRAGNSSRTGGRTRGPTPKVDVNGKVIANTSSDPGINEAMEKLCESMRRSAMSRNLVKQLSGRSVQRSGSARSLSRSNSSGAGMRKQMLGRSLSGGLSRGDDGSGRGTPTRTMPIRRLSNSKHRLHARAAPGNRGAFRTNSMGSQASVHSQGGNTFLQLDDQSLGAL